jgi:isopentenyl diphosphate isomerase/L-lactate dehydrogenase-like FMN-dependent dehydrogenase
VINSKRAFLQYLAASPVLAAASASASIGAAGAAQQESLLYRTLDSLDDLDPELPRTLADVTSVFELEGLAERVLPPAHFGYILQGSGGMQTTLRNREAFGRYGMRPRRLQGIKEVDTSIRLLGKDLAFPIFLCPTNAHRAFHPEGEIATAKGARQANAMQMLSSLTTTAVEAVNEARGEPVWFQLYPTNVDAVRYELVDRAQKAGCPAIVVTVDDIGERKSEAIARYRRRDTRDCNLCHQRHEGMADFLRRKPMFQPYRLRPGFNIDNDALSFDHIKRLRDKVKVKLIVKGIMHPADAARCADIGVDGVMVSNHGGRVESGGFGTFDALPDIVAEVKGKVAILMDGGIRRGGDACKALAMGADAVGMGRPYLYGLATFGAEGVAAAMTMVAAEARQAMLHVGAARVSDLHPGMLNRIS